MTKSSLSPTQLQALDLLLQGETVTETALRLGLNRWTIHQWARHNLLFQATFQAAQQRHQADVLDRYHALATPALSLLQSILSDERTPQSLRLRAALAVLKSVETNGPAIPFTPAQDHQLNHHFQEILAQSQQNPTEPHTSELNAMEEIARHATA